MDVYTYIKQETDANKLYDGVRSILAKMDQRGKYPEDWEIKHLQRLTDARHLELTEETK